MAESKVIKGLENISELQKIKELSENEQEKIKYIHKLLNTNNDSLSSNLDSNSAALGPVISKSSSSPS